MRKKIGVIALSLAALAVVWLLLGSCDTSIDWVLGFLE